ncbi:uncharacterized protein LOC142334333 [Lycorma delicatula]|uniref:uncharacterized protein LOC142334333 n=1 Tax=Lycorma delicatula TaxID=130591 RepID=UPI003F5133D9
MLIGLINDKLFTKIPFGYELGQIANEIYGEVLKLYKLPLINITIQTSQEFIDRECPMALEAAEGLLSLGVSGAEVNGLILDANVAGMEWFMQLILVIKEVSIY